MKQKMCTVEQFASCVWRQSEWHCLQEGALPLLVENTRCRMFREGDTIYNFGELSDGVFLIERGLVSLERKSHDGEAVLFSLAGAGDTLGYRAALNGVIHRTSAIALEPVRTCFIQADYFCEIVGSNPQLGMEFLRKATNDLDDADDRYYRMVSYSARARVAYYLLQLSERYGKAAGNGTLEFLMPCSRTKLAGWIGIRAESLSRSLGKLRDAGIIQCSGSKIFVRDMVGLQQESVGWEKMSWHRALEPSKDRVYVGQ